MTTLRSSPVQCAGRAPPGIVDSLTILRGLAAWAVVLTHCLRLLETVPATSIPPWLAWLDLGDFAVLLFFCLSGFALTRAHATDAWDAPGWASFLTRRVLRVYPAFLASFAICLLTILPLASAGYLAPGTWIADTDRVPTLPIAAAYLSFTANLLGIHGYVNTAYWSLPIEFQFYLLFPPFLLLLRRSGLALVALASALAFAARHWHWPGQTADLAWVFAAGMLLARVPSTGMLSRHPWLTAATAFAIACVLSNLSLAALRALPGPLALYLGAAAILLIAAAAAIPVGARTRFPLRLLIRQGEISYSIYLFHVPPLLIAFWLLQCRHFAASPAVALVYAVTFPLTAILASASFLAIERPFIRLGGRLTRPSRGPNPELRPRP